MQTKKSFNLKFKEAKIYDAGGDLSKQWFVYYSYIHPSKTTANGGTCFHRFKIYENINDFKTLSQRRDICKAFVISINELLHEGFNPFAETRIEAEHEKDNITKCLILYLDFIASSSLSRHTKRKYKYSIETFKSWLSLNNLTNKKISEIKKENIRDYLTFIKSSRKITSGKTINEYLNNLRVFFNYIINNYDDYLLRNPATSITTEKVIIKGNVAYNNYEFESVKSEILKSDPYLWLICQIVYYAALRNESEAINLKIKDIDLENNKIYIDARISKSRQYQAVPIYPELKEVFISLNICNYKGDFYLFGVNDKPGEKRVGEDNFARRFRKIKTSLGLGRDYGIYSFKHTRACHLYDDGADLRDIQLLFRHSDLIATMSYLRTLGRVERDRILAKGRTI